MIDILFSILLGLILSIMIYHIYNPLIINKGPNSKHIVGQIYEYNGSKFKLEPEIIE